MKFIPNRTEAYKEKDKVLGELKRLRDESRQLIAELQTKYCDIAKVPVKIQKRDDQREKHCQTYGGGFRKSRILRRFGNGCRH